MVIYCPVFRIHGHRYRPRVRLLARWALAIRHERFPQGDVWRVWAGWLFVTVLVDVC